MLEEKKFSLGDTNRMMYEGRLDKRASRQDAARITNTPKLSASKAVRR